MRTVFSSHDIHVIIFLIGRHGSPRHRSCSLVQTLSVIVSVYGSTKETSSVKVLLFLLVRPQEPFWDLIGRVTPHQRFVTSNDFHEKKTTRSRITLNEIVGASRKATKSLVLIARSFHVHIANELYNAMICETYHVYNGSKDWDAACEVWKRMNFEIVSIFSKSQKKLNVFQTSHVFFTWKKSVTDQNLFVFGQHPSRCKLRHETRRKKHFIDRLMCFFVSISWWNDSNVWIYTSCDIRIKINTHHENYDINSCARFVRID